MSHALPVPAVILGGSDRRITDLPEQGRDKHPLAGFKGARIRVGQRSLVEVLVERLRASGAFDPLFVVGPAAVYARLLPGPMVIDADGSFGANIRAGIEALGARCPGRVIAFFTCDILPEPERLRRLMDRFVSDGPFDLWFPLVRAPDRSAELGASAWKPAYRIRVGPAEPPTAVLPGHLAIVDPAALRLAFLYRLLDAGYRTRNRPIDRRRGAMLRGVLAELVAEDFVRLLRLRAPTVTWTMLRVGLPAVRMLRDGVITLGDLERVLRTTFVRGRHRRLHPGRRVHLPIVDELFLARDIDTVEEARELGAQVAD
jgi:MobA-like NTP transferase domain